MRKKTRTVTIGLGHACCTGALCAHGSVRSPEEIARLLKGGGRELVLRGARPRDAQRLASQARDAGFERVVLATAELDRREPIAGVDAVRAVIFSHMPAVHDRIAGRERALAMALVGMRALSVPLELEVPLISPKLSDIHAVVDLAIRAVPSLRAVCFVSPPSPGRYDAISLDRAVRRAEEAGARVRFDGVPPCALSPEHRSLIALRRQPDRELTGACAACVVRTPCGGPTRAYARAHGPAGLSALTARPSARHRPIWGAAEREAARRVGVLVLRPTVHCNQDCLFCSANESSANAFSDPKEMLRAIARAASRGVRRISFSGGEPTLSPHLASFVEAARRCGVAEIELVTNGVLLDRKERVARLAEAGLTHAFVSLHAHDETLSRTLTQKDGDHARTLAAIDHFLDANVLVAINHVVSARNQSYLSAFVESVRARFGGRVLISFAFLTPQFKALEHAELWPRLSETKPHLHAALHRAVALAQPVVVGSRQGIPPCFLGPFAAWTDLFQIGAEAASEDAPQKTRGPACARCRYRELCTGVWKPYAARFGFDELAPIEGEPFSAEELASVTSHPGAPPWAVPRTFEEAPPLLRDREAELAPPPLPRRVALPIHRPARSRPLRVILIGSGPRARALAEAMPPSMALTAIASPHAPESPAFGALPRYRDAREAIDELRPEAAIVAAATDVHAELVAACAGLPVLLEKPVARTLAQARAIEGWVSCAHQELFAPQMPPHPTRILRRTALPPWGRAPLFEALHHVVGLLRPRSSLKIHSVQFQGAARPEHVRVVLEGAEIVLESATHDELAVQNDLFSWSRRGPRIEVDGSPIEGAGSDDERMLDAFQRAVIAGEDPPVPIAEGVAVLESCLAILDALEDAGAPLVRPGAPKHVASPRYRMDGSRR